MPGVVGRAREVSVARLQAIDDLLPGRWYGFDAVDVVAHRHQRQGDDGDPRRRPGRGPPPVGRARRAPGRRRLLELAGGQRQHPRPDAPGPDRRPDAGQPVRLARVVHRREPPGRLREHPGAGGQARGHRGPGRQGDRLDPLDAAGGPRPLRVRPGHADRPGHRHQALRRLARPGPLLGQGARPEGLQRRGRRPEGRRRRGSSARTPPTWPPWSAGPSTSSRASP